MKHALQSYDDAISKCVRPSHVSVILGLYTVSQKAASAAADEITVLVITAIGLFNRPAKVPKNIKFF